MSGFNDYMATIRSHFQKGLLKACPDVEDQASEVLAEAYLVTIDSLHVELTYGDAKPIPAAWMHCSGCRGRSGTRRLFGACESKRLVGFGGFARPVCNARNSGAPTNTQ